jgi:hypothetical protein
MSPSKAVKITQINPSSYNIDKINEVPTDYNTQGNVFRKQK